MLDFRVNELELRSTGRHSIGVLHDEGAHERRIAPKLDLPGYICINAGLVDSVTIIGTILGTFLMISLTTNIKRNFLIFSIIHSIFFCMLTLSPQIPNDVGQIIILICMFIVGIAKASIVFPQILFGNFFHSGEEKFYFNLWYGITFLGDTCGILISKAIISMLRLGWEVNLYFFSAVLCTSTFLIFFLI